MKTSNKSVFLLIIFFHTIITAQEMIVPNNTVRTYNENEKIYMFSNSKIFEYEPEKNKIVNEIEFKNINYDIEDFPGSECYFNRCLSIPMYPQLTCEDQEHVISSLGEFLS